MNKRTGAKGALLDEYEKALAELKQVISGVSPMELSLPADKTTSNQNCISIQSILTHVVDAGYTYANYIRKLKNAPFKVWEKASRTAIADYNDDLNQMFTYTIETFSFFNEEETMEPTDSKILTHWQKTYDIEQMWEHAIVHLLRHRRQIEKFKKIVT